MLAAALCLPSGVVAQSSPKVKTVGIRVIREVVGEDSDKLVPFNTFEKGTAVALLIESGGASIIKVDERASKIVSFKDDGGKDLMVNSKGFNRNGLGSFPKVSEDGKAAVVEVNAAGVPDAGASKVVVEGTLVLQTASEKKAVKSAPFELKKGAAVKVGDIEMTLKSVGKPSFGDDAVELGFETSNKGITMLASVKFYDESGKELESESRGSSSMGFGNKFTYGKDYSLKEAVEGKLVVEFEVWTDLAETEVPIKIAAGVGG